MIVHDCEQYSPTWWDLRRGIPTASEFSRIITPKTQKLAAAHTDYIYQLIGDGYDLDYGQKDDFANAAMRRGTQMEPESRRFFEYETGRDVRQVGFITTDDGRVGCSPDGLLDDGSILELKNPNAKTHLAWLFGGVLPDEHKCQVHGEILIADAPHGWFLSYYPRLPHFLVKVDQDGFTTALADVLNDFCGKLAETKAKIANWGLPTAQAA